LARDDFATVTRTITDNGISSSSELESDQEDEPEKPSYSSLLDEDPFQGGPTCCEHDGFEPIPGSGLW